MNVYDLKNISRVCKRFNEIIADSAELMEVFSIKLHDEKHIGRFRESFSNSIRKYSALKIYANIDMDTVYLKLPNSPQYIKCTVNKESRDQWTRYYWSFLSGMGIKHLEFGSIVDLNILDCVKNSVESLHLWNSKINYPEKVQTIEWKKMKKLFVCVWESKLESFFPETLEKLGFDQSLSADQMKFINKQKDLKDLSVKCDSCCQNEDLGRLLSAIEAGKIDNQISTCTALF